MQLVTGESDSYAVPSKNLQKIELQMFRLLQKKLTFVHSFAIVCIIHEFLKTLHMHGCQNILYQSKVILIFFKKQS